MRFDMMKRMISFMLAMILLFSCVPVNAFATGTESTQETETASSVTTGFEGKTVSILGDSISTYTGVSNNTSYNSTIGSNAVYYTAGRYDIYRADTWWQQVIDALGMELLVNNSWSGSMVVYPRRGEGSEGYKTRCVNLHNNEGQEPDVILVFMGTNDFSYVNTEEFLGLYTLGTADAVDYETLIVDNGDGTYTYATPATTCEAYAIMLHKMKNRYPNAEIYCMNLMQRRDPDYADSYADAGQPTEFNAELAKIIAKYECTLVDLENCGIEADSSVFDLYIGDKRVHPNSLGMDLMSEAVISAMLGQDTDIYDVSFDLTNVTGDGAHAVLPGNPYTVTLAETEGFKNMSVTVTMGGEDVTANCYADGVVSIPSVIGDVVITAEATERDPLNFRWEFDGTDLATITSDGNAENLLTKLAGSVTDSMFSNTRYQMDRTVMLLHDRPWILEWKGTGKGGVMLAADSVATTGDPFFFRRQASQMFAFGIYEGSQYNNYGITLPESIDTTLEHTYRLENRIADDGSNMVYLYVDDAEIGALNQYFVAGTAQGTTSDWICGQDFLFNYIGTESHPLTDMSVTYLQIEEDSSVHHHGYTAVVTPPTYTEGGYTTYTCAGCGDSYVADYTDAIALYSYRWEMVDNELQTVTSDGNTANPLTLNAGSVTDGTFTGARYTLNNSVRLYHDAPWGLEWKASGDWSAMLLTSTAQSATEDMTFIFRTYNETGLLALGTYSGGSYHNYGIALADYDLDMTQEHTYRLENRIAEDGSNMVYLTVDGTELGAMNNYYIGGTNNQNQTVDWVNGRDFTFGFMGSTSHPLKDMALSYLQVWEGGDDAVAWEIGTILAANGQNSSSTTRLRTVDYLRLSDYTGISVNTDYMITYLVYDSDRNYLGNGSETLTGNWLGDGVGISFADVLTLYPDAVYFRVALCASDGAEMTLADVTASGVRFAAPEVEDSFWESGTIAAATGQNSANTTRLRTADYLPLANYSGVTLNNGYMLTWFAYDESQTYLGNGTETLTANWLGDGMGVTSESILTWYPDAVYFRIAMRAVSSSEMTLEHVATSGITFYAPGETVPLPESDLEQEYVMSMKACQDGAIYDGKVFLLNASGDCTVYSITDMSAAGSFTLDGTDIICPHANSVCFSDTFYAEGDIYPLLYVNVYNTYSGAEDRMEGTCCVYRIVETDGVFTSELVQVIRIGFTEDLDLWKSLENNGDVRPYGNFVVDTDNNTLYAFTMRDADMQTRFFAFDLPGLDSGAYSETYGCNVVTLEETDIQTMFDVEYFSYMQGCCYGDGRVLSVEGFGSGSSAEPVLRIVNLRTQSVERSYALSLAGLSGEPEMISYAPENGNLYFAAADGILRKLSLLDYSSWAGKTLSILGASMSTYTGISNNADTNSTIGNNAVYYTEGRHGVYANDTWWMQVANDLDLRLLVNNSWSGSSLLYTRNGTVGAYVDRCVQLHDDTGDNAGEEPDIIGIQMGTNDYQYFKDTLGTADIDYDTLIVAGEDGAYTYAEPTTSLEAAAIVMHKISIRYPEAEAYYLNLSQRVDITDETAGILETFNENLATVCAHFGVTIVDIYNSGITQENFDTYIGDGRVHPNCFGMDAYTEAFKKALLGNHEELTAYTVDFQLSNVTADYGVDKQVLSGKSFSCTLTAPEYFEPKVTVTMGGEDITDSCYADGVVTIEEVTADVVITAEAVLDHEPANYRWEFDGSDLATVTTDGNVENVLTKLAGSSTDGVFSTTSYSLEKTVVLSHDQPWSVEWKSEGTWKGTSTSGGRLFSTASTSSNDTRYIFKSVNSYLIAMGERTSSGSYNYGIALTDHGIDGSARHIYRLENRIAEDGSNMVWLYVDGVEIGALNNLYMGTTDQNTTSDWLSGQDFLFPYIGTETHGLNNCSVDYVQVWEGGADHYHVYTAVVTEPTYTAGGYTTYTCECGHSFVDDYTDPIALHTYRWELVEDALVPVTTDGAEENLLSLQNGSITDGEFTNVLYNIDTSIHLYHDQPWVIEWKSSGDNARTAGGTAGGSGLLSSNTVLKSDEGTWFLYKRPSNYLIALCYRDASTSIQSGIALADHGIDGSELHTYRLENRVAEDGSNMVYLIVDGLELGAMNNLFVSAVDQGETTDFLNGLDWTFDYMGITNYYLNSCSIEYMQIWESGEPTDFEGKTISILGDSISTYTGVSDDASVNATLSGGAIYYTPGRWDIYQEDTWWQQTIDALGMELLVNNSWSGSCVLHTRRGTVGAYVDRCVQLHNDKTGEEPDVIVTFIAANDFSYYQDTLGTAAIAYDTLIVENADGSFTYAEPTTTCEAYAIMLHKMTARYPNAQIYCMTPTARRDPDKEDDYADVGQPTAFNAELMQITEYFGCKVVDLETCGIDKEAEVFDQYIADGRTHPNAEGMDLITQALIRVMLGTDAVLLDVSAEYVGVSSDNGAAAALSGKSYVANLTVQNGYTDMNVTVTMGGEDVTDTVYSDGMICIEKVTGDIVISAAAEREPQSFRWEFDGSELVSTGETENALSALAGAFTDGVLNDGRYDITIPVLLKHDLPWELEWQFAEDWRGVVLSSDPAQNTTGMYYLSRTKGGQLCLGTWTGTQYDNYGVDLSYLDDQPHTYRLVNRVAVDGSNMVWLYVDGLEIGPMNNYYIGSKDQSTTSDWVSGKDFVFAYMGIEGHPVTNCAVGYIQVWEGGRPADYTGKVISVMGDSISTFAGYIPVADGFNREHLARYPQDNLLTDVNETWWMQVVAELDAKLGINESWRGSTLSGAVPVTTGDTGENAAMSNLIRIQNMGSNGTPDVILLYGGTNDLAHVSEVGTFDPATAPTEVDLTTKKWDNLADGFVHTLLRMRYYYPDAVILAMLPTYTASYYTDEKLDEGNAVMAQICEHYGIPYVDLRDSGVTADHLPDGIHPGEEGMDLITTAVVEALLEKAELEPGEHVVYPVSHELTQVKASLGHWKGVDANSTFTEVLTGEEMTVTVTMDGVDITADCYEDGTITIETVTGALVITATGKFTLDGHLQQLPDPYCSVNLWQALEHDEMYYASGGWTTHASGQVKSVTFPVTPGDRLYASSFGAAGTNGGTINGIRVTYFAEDGTADSIDADKIYEEFSTYGYLTVPDDAVAVSIPMWTDSEDWEIYLYCVLHSHLQQLPEGAYNDTNLWPRLEHDAEYYSADGWATHSSGNVKSVTIPVSPGDKLYASSFGAAGTNGSSTNGIRVTYFAEHSVLVSVGAATVYQEFSENGYLTVPEGVYAVSIPMWTDSEDWELYILTLTDRNVYKGKVISIMGDSISTFDGYIPVADGFNLQHYARYPQDNLLTDVNETWWMQVLTALDAKLGINESWRSTEVYNYIDAEVNSTYDGTKACMASTTRIQNLGSNGTPDVILFYGGTNDINQSRPLGSFDPETAPTEVDLTTVKWDSVADAYVTAIMRMQYYYPDALIVAMLPTYTSGRYSDETLAEYNAVFAAICDHYGVPYVDLRYCGISTADLPDGIHPDATGMDYISSYVLDFLMNECDMVPGEHIVYPVSHELTNVTASLGYWKGVSAGRSFEETLTGENMTVTITMGGMDITAECYADGKITIAEVTGALVITASGDADPDALYADHLQQIPEDAYNDTNLWTELTPENIYYNGSEWGLNATGTVHSVTVPVTAGDQLWATSFQESGANGGTRNGIRVTYFMEDGSVVSVKPDDVYDEFSTNGYLTVPEGAVAVNIAMWDGSETNEFYILTLPDRPVVTVEISWGAMEFTYTDGAWDPDTHTYAEGTWTADENSNYITVANEGTLDATVTFVYENAEGYAFAGTFVDGETAVITDSLILPADATQTVWLTLVGRPDEYLDYVTIGTVTIIVE